jgi:hypothetical protein
VLGLLRGALRLLGPARTLLVALVLLLYRRRRARR